MSLKDVIDVSISRETQAVSRAGFGIMLVLGTNKAFNERVRYYTSPDAVLEDFSADSLEYKAVNAAFSQEPSPKQVAIGRRAADVARLSLDFAVSREYTITIDGVDHTFTSGATSTLGETILGLVQAVNDGISGVVATSVPGDFIQLTAAEPGKAFTLKTNQYITIAPYTPSASMAEDLTACADESNDWYGLVITSRSQPDVLAAAEWVESRRKIFGTVSNEQNIIRQSKALDETSIMAQLREQGYARTFCMYHQSPEEFSDAAWFGKMLPTQPGAATWMFKTLKSIPATRLTETQTKNARDKNCNVYEELGGVSIAREGKVASGEYIDVMIGCDWLQSRLTERIYSKIVNLPKIPYTDAGVSIIETEIKAQLKDAQNVGFIATDPEPTIVVPKVADVDFNSRAKRILPDVKFRATLQSAIHAISVIGTISV